jgi:hypothetical protein
MELSVRKMRRSARYHAAYETVKESMNEKGGRRR